MRLAARNLRILHARFEELEALTRVGLELEPGVEREIARGRMLRALLRQDRLSRRGSADQVIALLAVSEGWLDGLAPDDASSLAENLAARARSQHPDLVARLEQGELPEEGWLDETRDLCAAMRGARPETEP
jgi:F-type H+-transporting ATPase subunit alpha